MRPDAHELQNIGTRLPVNQHQVGFDVAVPMVFPFAGQSMVAVLSCKWQIIGQRCNDVSEVNLQRLTVRTLCLAFEITFELTGWFNRPHSGLPSNPRQCQTTLVPHGALPSSPQW